MASILDDLQFDQNDLEKVCRQPEITLPELSGTNRAYGMGRLYRDYAGLPDGEPLAFSADHGVPIDPEFKDPVDFNHGLPTFLAAYPERVESFVARGKPRVVHGAFPIHYARALLDRNPTWNPPAERKGTIAFPRKSAANIDRTFDFERFAQWLADLPDEFQPVIVCIFWMDFLKERHLPYTKRGLQVVSCGNFFDTQFLYRFIDLCSRTKYACGNEAASSYPLSVVCGCRFFYTDVGPVQRVHTTRGRLSPEDSAGTSENARRLITLAPYPPDRATQEEQSAFSAYLTGGDHVLSPEAVREIQGWSRNWLLEHQAPEISIVQEAPLAALNTWIPKAISRDGWAGANCRVVAAPAAQPTTLQVCLKLSPRISREPQTLDVTFGGAQRFGFECRPGFYVLELPLSAGGEHEVEFRFPAEADISGEGNRRVAFRFLGWRRVPGADRKPTCVRTKREDLPVFAAPPEGW